MAKEFGKAVFGKTSLKNKIDNEKKSTNKRVKKFGRAGKQETVVQEDEEKVAPLKNIASDFDEKDIQKLIDKEKTKMKEHMNEIIVQTTEKYEHIFLRSFPKFKSDNINNFFWRVFSVYARKPGKDLSILIVSIQVIML